MTKNESIESILFGLDIETEPHLILIEEVGDGEVRVGESFEGLPSLQQADLLQDWIVKLEEMKLSVTAGTFLQDMGGSGINNPPASGAIN